MRLKKAQKEQTLKWVAAGLQTDEINDKAATFDEPFEVSRQQVDYYRKTREADIRAIRSISENKALIEGYALKEHRVYKLSVLAALMEKDLFGGFLWTDQVKGVGSGDIAEIVDYEEFNAGEVVQYRGVLDDIAKEMGGRIQKTDVTSGGEPLCKYDNDARDRAISTLADALRENLSGAGNKPEGAMDASEQTPMASLPEQSG
jgi:hypothetical protein